MLGGIKGDIIEIGILRTTLMEIGEWVVGDNYSGRIVRVANSFVFKEPVFNYSADFHFLWEELTLPVHYSSDIALAEKIMLEAINDELGVIIPFLSGLVPGLHAASFSFMAGVIPPMPMFGRSLL